MRLMQPRVQSSIAGRVLEADILAMDKVVLYTILVASRRTSARPLKKLPPFAALLHCRKDLLDGQTGQSIASRQARNVEIQ